MAAIEPRSEGPLFPSEQGARVTRDVRAQLRSERGAGVVADDVSAGAGDELSVAAGAALVSVVVVVVEVSVGAALFSVDDGSVVVLLVLAGIVLVSVVVAAGVDCVVVVVLVSVDCATAAPMPASRAAAAATADNFF